MGIIEKIKEIEAEMARTQKNKATGSLYYLYFDTSYCIFDAIFVA